MQVAVEGEVVERRGDVPEDPPPVPDRVGVSTVEIGGELELGTGERGGPAVAARFAGWGHRQTDVEPVP